MKRIAWNLACLAVLLIALPPSVRAGTIPYAPCADAATQPTLHGTLCARVPVPAVYGDAAAGTFTLFVRKFPAASASRGSVWAIAGGPGESGASLYAFADVLRRSFPGFDVIVPDHRGTGASTRVCPAEEAPDSAGGTALAGTEWTTCFARLQAHPGLARQFTLTAAARDLAGLVATDSSTQDSGTQDSGTQDSSKPVYLYGVSYGTQLVLRTAQLGRLPVAGIVLDSLVPMQDDARWDLSRRSLVVDDVGRHVLAHCDADKACAAALGAPAAAVYARVLSRADPALLARVPGKDLRQFLGALLDMPALRDRIPYLIADLDRGHTGELDALLAAVPAIQATLGDYPQSPPSIPLTGIVSNSESDLRPGRSAAAVRQEEAPLLFRSPLPGILATSTLPRYPRDERFGHDPDALPPTLVLQGTLDPKTHYDGAAAHVAALRTHGTVGMVSVQGAPHFILWTAPGCFERQVSAFVTGTRPADATCRMY